MQPRNHRLYERIGLLPVPASSEGGYQLYRLDDQKRLSFIRGARGLGFSLDEMRALLHLADESRQPCQEARDLATRHLEDIQAKLADLRTMGRVLKRTMARCANGRLPEREGAGRSGARDERPRPSSAPRGMLGIVVTPGA